MRVVLVALTLLALTLSGCTEDDSGPSGDIDTYTGPKAELATEDVYIDGMERAFVHSSVASCRLEIRICVIPISS